MQSAIDKLTYTMVRLALLEMYGKPISNASLAGIVDSIEHINTNWNRYYTINTLHYYRDTGLCVTEFGGKIYSL